jgi:DNA-binding response OmpR family regulator
MKRVIIFSDDFSLCYSLLVYLQNHYKLVVTTDLEFFTNVTFNSSTDIVFIDREPDPQLIRVCEKIKKYDSGVPIFLSYVFSKRVSQMEHKIREFVDDIFYKPFDLNEISAKLSTLLDRSQIPSS